MPSAVDPTKPLDNVAAAKSDFRAALQTIKTELEHGGFVRAAAASASERTAQDKLSEWLSVKDFIASSDPDATNGLIRMRDYLRLDRSKPRRILFPPGLYEYTNNRWLAHVGAVTIEGHGAQFRCTGGGGTHANSRPFNTQSIFMNAGNNPFGVALTYDTGYLISTVGVNARSVACTTASQAGNFTAGDRVLIHAFDQQPVSYPPNMRYFEWNVVSAANSSTGVVTLRLPTQNEYRADLRDHDAGSSLVYGKARIMKLERNIGNSTTEFYYSPRLELIGVELLKHPTEDHFGANAICISADTLIWRDVKAIYGAHFPTETRLTLYEDCTMRYGELDKICDYVILRRCRWEQLISHAAATGVNNLIHEDCYFDRSVALSSRRIYFRRCMMLSEAGNQFGVIRTHGDYPVELIELEDNTVVHDGALLYAINLNEATALTVGSVGAQNQILLAYSTAIHNLISSVGPGNFMYRSDGGNYGFVTSVGWDGSNYVIAGTWRGTVTAGETWRFDHVHRVRERGTKIVGTPVKLFRDWRARQHVDRTSIGKPTVVRLTNQFPWGSTQTLEIWGFVRSVKAHVLEPDTGATGTVNLTVVTAGGSEFSSWTTLQTLISGMSLKARGTVEITQYADTTRANPAVGSGGPSAITAINPTTFVSALRITFGSTAASDLQKARLWIEVECEPLTV